MTRKTKSLHSIMIEGCNFSTQLNYNTNTNHIGIGTSHNYSKSYKKAYYEKNKVEIKARSKVHHENNRIKDKAYHKIYHKTNKEKLNANKKAYYEANKDKAKAYNEANKDKLKSYREDNKDKIKTKNKSYRENNKDKIKVNYEKTKIKVKAYHKIYYESNRDPNIPCKGSEEYRIQLSCTKQGINRSDFTGFLTNQRYCTKFNNQLRKQIRNHYNNCDYISGLHKDVCNKGINLDVHHVDYNKQQGCDSDWKLIPLSRSNHAKTNTNRPFWNRLFTYSLQYEKEYYEDESK